MIELTNDFHNTSARVKTTALSTRTVARLHAELCGADDCYCGIVRDPNWSLIAYSNGGIIEKK